MGLHQRNAFGCKYILNASCDATFNISVHSPWHYLSGLQFLHYNFVLTPSTTLYIEHMTTRNNIFLRLKGGQGGHYIKYYFRSTPRPMSCMLFHLFILNHCLTTLGLYSFNQSHPPQLLLLFFIPEPILVFPLFTHVFVTSPLCNHINSRPSQHFFTWKQLTKTLRSKHPALYWLIVVYCLSVNFATYVNAHKFSNVTIYECWYAVMNGTIYLYLHQH